MKIAILGTKGIPNNYGGFEQFAEFISIKLVERGHKVTVYNPSNHPYDKKEFKGVAIIRIYCPEGLLGASSHFVYDFLSLRDALRRDFDVIYEAGYHSVALSYIALSVKKIRKPIILTNMDGLEWKRSKWNYLTRFLIKKLEATAVKKCHHLISDNLGIKDYLKQNYDKDSIFIPYGAELVDLFEEKALLSYSLQAFNYFILVARLEPENNIEAILNGYLKSQTKEQVIVVGSHKTKYGSFLKSKYCHPNIRFVGGIYDKYQLDSLRHYSLAYFHGHSVGGTNPSLLEAMSSECFIIAHKNTFNVSVLGDSALYFQNEFDIADLLKNLKSFLATSKNEFIKSNLRKIRTRYTWGVITEEHERVFLDLLNKSAY
jgi:glycosyltransferase involved in cell wall biosynthesis